jgi:hypothetical protein
LSSEDTTVSFSLEVNVDKAYENLRKAETVLYRTLGLVRRLSGDENLDKAIAKIQEAIALINSLRLAIVAFQAATGPLGWALAGIGTVTALMTTAEMMAEAQGY